MKFFKPEDFEHNLPTHGGQICCSFEDAAIIANKKRDKILKDAKWVIEHYARPGIHERWHAEEWLQKYASTPDAKDEK
jgi:hypothetical protein